MLKLITTFLVLFYMSAWAADETPALKKLLKSYEKAAPNSEESFSLAVRISLLKILNQDRINEASLSQSEQTALKNSNAELERVQALTKELESKLTPADIKTITKENPASIHRTTGKFRIGQSANDCTPGKFEELKKHVDLAELLDRGLIVSAYVAASEGPFTKQYIQNLTDLVRKDARFVTSRPLLKTVLNDETAKTVMNDAGVKNLLDGLSTDDKKRIERYEDKLIKAGVPKNEIKAYTTKMVLLSPECLGTISPQFLKLVRRDFGKVQIEKLAERMKGATLTEDDITNGPDRFKDEKNPYLKSTKDPWYGSFEISKVGKDQVVIISKGEDRKPSDDDLRSQPIQVKFAQSKN